MSKASGSGKAAADALRALADQVEAGEDVRMVRRNVLVDVPAEFGNYVADSHYMGAAIVVLTGGATEGWLAGEIAKEGRAGFAWAAGLRGDALREALGLPKAEQCDETPVSTWKTDPSKIDPVGDLKRSTERALAEAGEPVPGTFSLHGPVVGKKMLAVGENGIARQAQPGESPVGEAIDVLGTPDNSKTKVRVRPFETIAGRRYAGSLGRLFEMRRKADAPILPCDGITDTLGPCPDCNGTGKYQGLGLPEPCKSCEGSGGV